ncbi:hypothetical protein J7K18_02975 [bacterium]|nr:hypothetical protein [bacterium]
MHTADNRAHLATVLRISAQILLRRTSDTLGTFGGIAVLSLKEEIKGGIKWL